MFLSLWYYMRGYVIVEVTGYSIDKFIRLAVANRVVLWKVARRNDRLYMHTSIEGFKRLKPYAKKSRCRIRIIEKKGLPFLTFRYRKRWLFGVGGLLFVLWLYILSSFVWVVDVTGNSRVDTGDIIKCLDEHGYGTGRFKGSLALREAEQILMNTYPEIVWTGIKFEGTKLLVQVSEAVPKPEIYEEGVPSDIIAKRDTLITYIVAEKGMPVVKVGDTVKQGDVLISGKMSSAVDEQIAPVYTESIGEVIGKTGYSLRAQLPLTKIDKQYTQEVATSYSVTLFSKRIPLYTSKKSFPHYDELITINQLRLTDLFPLPFYFEKSEKVAYVPQEVEVSVEDAQDLLIGILFDTLYEQIGEDAKILKQEILYTELDGELIAELNVIAEESVAVHKELSIEDMMPEQIPDVEGVN